MKKILMSENGLRKLFRINEIKIIMSFWLEIKQSYAYVIPYFVFIITAMLDNLRKDSRHPKDYQA